MHSSRMRTVRCSIVTGGQGGAVQGERAGGRCCSGGGLLSGMEGWVVAV